MKDDEARERGTYPGERYLVLVGRERRDILFVIV